ncbi:FKBP-type peptidyl-prolyl cis-trans isomerase [Microbacterium sulfonylureivorans]|uniref:FKBP-type peptidyl-prolyl cis-trans isomerase n=1 Tax=Microbacterium sulfonylureivorans TaxID=2486854 RepID=UPI000FDB5F01|nr:FKBP-type peptidyl-prolyl cis-trans isomerase [Microbacterium sulfonylureivorans]
MRIRPIAALSVAALSAVLLAGCAGAAPEASPSPTGTGSADLCAAAAPSGAASESIEVDGEAGEQSTATFPAPLEVEELQSTVVVEGEGDPVAAGDLVTYALSAFNAETGEELGSFGYGDSPVLPQQISPENPLGQLLGCATPGTRVVATFPATEEAAAEVYIVDLLEVVPSAAWGEEQDPVDGMPTVELAEDGAPTVTLPEGDMPTEFEKATLKKGDGPVVETGDGVLVQYHGVSWNSGEVFDQSWGGAPFSFTAGSGVVQGFTDAVVGETVGSQVIAVLPPSVAYGEGEITDADLTGQTLVFVIDILGVQSATAAE